MEMKSFEYLGCRTRYPKKLNKMFYCFFFHFKIKKLKIKNIFSFNYKNLYMDDRQRKKMLGA